MQFTRAIVRPPGEASPPACRAPAKGRPTSTGPSNSMRIRGALRDCGIEVTQLPADDAYPDATFVEDTAIVSARGAILMRPGAPSRQGEVSASRSACAISTRSGTPSRPRARWTAAIFAKWTDIF